MQPIERTIAGHGYLFAISLADAQAIIATDPMLSPQTRSPAVWAATIRAAGPAHTPQVEPKVIRALLAKALLSTDEVRGDTRADIAERIHRNSLNNEVNYLAAEIVEAAVAAG